MALLLQEERDELKEKYKVRCAELRKTIVRTYTVSKKDKWYKIVATTENIIPELENECKPREYQPFFIINNVIIIDGSGCVLKVKTGDILTDEEINQLDNGIVPSRLIE